MKGECERRGNKIWRKSDGTRPRRGIELKMGVETGELLKKMWQKEMRPENTCSREVLCFSVCLFDFFFIFLQCICSVCWFGFFGFYLSIYALKFYFNNFILFLLGACSGSVSWGSCFLVLPTPTCTSPWRFRSCPEKEVIVCRFESLYVKASFRKNNLRGKFPLAIPFVTGHQLSLASETKPWAELTLEGKSMFINEH